HVEPFAMPELVGLDFVGNRRTRTDDAHVAAQYVEELRQFIEARFAEQAADTRNALIGAQLVRRAIFVAEVRFRLPSYVFALKLAMRGVVGAGTHGAKLKKEEYPPIHSHSLLPVKNRPEIGRASCRERV